MNGCLKVDRHDKLDLFRSISGMDELEFLNFRRKSAFNAVHQSRLPNPVEKDGENHVD